MKYRVIASVEISRTNITPKAFFGYCKREVERRTGGKLSLTNWLDNYADWEKPYQESEYHMNNHEEWGADARREAIKVKPFDVQWYFEGSYNFIMEFDFWDEKTGFGYLYMVEMEEEPEQPTEPEQTEETETETTTDKEENEIMNYSYEDAMKSDILDYIAENVSRGEYIENREELEETLNDDLWADDSVTGNASGSYYCNAYKAKTAVLDNMEYCTESLKEFCTEPETIAEHFLNEDWEYFDVTIRCYLLGQMISAVLDELEEAGYFEESETDESDIIETVRAEIA